MIKRSLLIVANRSQARIFEVKKPGNHLTEVQTLHNKQGRALNQDLVTDRPGTTSDGSGHNAMAPSQDPAEHNLMMFASKVAQVADDTRRKSQLISLDIIAEPHFLGALRQKLDHQTVGLIDQAIDKDVVDADEETFRNYLKRV